MSSSFDNTVAGPVQPSGDASVVHDSPISATDEAQAFDYVSSTTVNVSGGGFSPHHPELSSFYAEKENDTPFRGDYMAPDGSVLPPPSEMLPEEGFALREWRRQNALRIEEKEKMEKELLNQIIDEAEDYKINFHLKRKTVCDNNIATNRESEKIYLAGRDKFHADADKNYWKAIADLIPKEVPVIETRGAKKDQDKKPSVVVIHGPKPGKPTDLSRMRQILVKLKHNTPLHLKLSPPSPAAKDAAAVAPPAEAVAVA